MMLIPASVNICIPTYNSEKTLKATLNSLVGQTYQDIKIHIVDNASTDRTLEVARSVGDSRITIHENTLHIPYCEGNWDRCFSYMVGEFGAIFHSDDVYLPTMIETQVKALRFNPDICAVFTGAYFINKTGRIISELELPPEYRNKKVEARDILISTLKHGCKLMCPSPLFRAGIFRGLAPFRYDRFRYSSDLDFWLRAAEISKIMVLDGSLMMYRISSEQESTAIHHRRTSEAGLFPLCDHYVSKYPDLPSEALDKYEMRRLEDKVVCIRNSVKKFGSRLPKYLWWGFMEKVFGEAHE